MAKSKITIYKLSARFVYLQLELVVRMTYRIFVLQRWFGERNKAARVNLWGPWWRGAVVIQVQSSWHRARECTIMLHPNVFITHSKYLSSVCFLGAERQENQGGREGEAGSGVGGGAQVGCEARQLESFATKQTNSEGLHQVDVQPGRRLASGDHQDNGRVVHEDCWEELSWYDAQVHHAQTCQLCECKRKRVLKYSLRRFI